MASCPNLVVRVVDTDSPDFSMLSSKLEAELELRYPGLSEDEPTAAPDFSIALVAYLGDAAVGCGAMRELEPGVGEVKRMFVVPEARGMGAARRVLGKLEAQAFALGFSALRLGTGLRQPEALALYESSGYRRIPLFGEYEGADVCVCYEKTLRCG
jgi:putative acetyltransferase